jgi:hypothetical protein
MAPMSAMVKDNRVEVEEVEFGISEGFARVFVEGARCSPDEDGWRREEGEEGEKTER